LRFEISGESNIEENRLFTPAPSSVEEEREGIKITMKIMSKSESQRKRANASVKSLRS